MKLPEYFLKKDISIKDPNVQADPIIFAAGTLVFPFWNETLLPEHISDELKEQLKFAPKNTKYIMCIIGQMWIPVPEDNIRSN